MAKKMRLTVSARISSVEKLPARQSWGQDPPCAQGWIQPGPGAAGTGLGMGPGANRKPAGIWH